MASNCDASEVSHRWSTCIQSREWPMLRLQEIHQEMLQEIQWDMAGHGRTWQGQVGDYFWRQMGATSGYKKRRNRARLLSPSDNKQLVLSSHSTNPHLKQETGWVFYIYTCLSLCLWHKTWQYGNWFSKATFVETRMASGRGKGGKGLGKGGAKRHRKILRDNIQGMFIFFVFYCQVLTRQTFANRSHETRHSPSRASWWCQAHLWSHLRRDPRSLEDFPWRHSPWHRHVHWTREAKDCHGHRRCLRSQA